MRGGFGRGGRRRTRRPFGRAFLVRRLGVVLMPPCLITSREAIKSVPDGYEYGDADRVFENPESRRVEDRTTGKFG